MNLLNFNLTSIFLFTLLLPLLIIILISIKNNYKHILTFLLLLILAVFVILCTLMFTLFIIIKIIFLIRTTKLMPYGMQYEFISIKTKLLTKKWPIFILITELIKLFVFIISYNFFKNHNKHNIYFLSIISFFIISFKVIFLMLFFLLNHKFNNDFKTYLLNNTNKFMCLFKSYKIEFHYGQIDFNFTSGTKTGKFLSQFFSKTINNQQFNLENFLNNNKNICASFEKVAHNLKKDCEKSKNPEGFWYKRENDNIFHYGKINKDKTVAGNVSSNIKSPSLNNKYIETYPLFENLSTLKNNRVPGLVVMKLQNDVKLTLKENRTITVEYILDLKTYLTVLETQEGVVEGWDLLSIEKIKNLNIYITDLEKKLEEYKVFNSNSDKNLKIFKKDTINVILLSTFSKLYFPDDPIFNIWDIKKQITDK